MLRSSCTICMDILSEDLMACPCGHVYHSNCLTRWFVHNQTCPTCRKSCSNTIKLYFNDLLEASSEEDIETVKNKLRNQIALVKEKEFENKNIQKELGALTMQFNELKEVLEKSRLKLQRECEVREALKQQVQFLTENMEEKKKLSEELKKVKRELTECNRVKTMILGSHEEAEEMLRSIGSGPKTVNELASQLIIMKRENEKMRDAKKKATSDKEKLEREFNSVQHELKRWEVQVLNSSKEIESLQEQVQVAEQEKQSLKKKLDKLQQSFQSPSPRSSIINRLLRESPAPLHLTQPVALTSETDENVEFTASCDEQESSIKSTPSTTPGYSIEMFSPVHPGALRQNRKRTFMNFNMEKSDTGRYRQGYNGLGGRSKVLMPPKTTVRVKKKVTKPANISKFVRRTGCDDPPLPQL